MSEEKKEVAKQRESIEESELRLEEAKIRLRNACNAYQPLGSVRKHPVLAPVCAFFAGFGLMRIVKPVAGMALLPFALQIAQLGTKIFLNYSKK